jgi:predicted nuclease of restriction endonuclease-like (RecB) superfamily
MGQGQIYPQAVGNLEELPIFNIPWGHNIAIFEGVKSLEERLWYANMVIQEGWSRNALIDSIKIKTYQRHGKAITNFHDRLPSPHSKLAHDTLKDPYNFDFLELTREHVEKDLEDGLLAHVEKFLCALGQGFSFVGRQVNLVVGKKDFYFEKQGFIVLSEQTILRKRVELTNYKMEKRLCKNAEGGLVNTAEIIAEYYKAMGQRDFEKLEKLLSSDVQFIGPLAKLKGKEAVIEATKRFTSLFKALNVRAKFGSNNQAMVVYDLDCPEPIGLFSSSALMTFESGLIAKIELFYDARPFDKK